MQVNLSTSGGATNLAGTVTVTAAVHPPAHAETPVTCKFYVDGVLKSTDTSYPLTFSWDTTTVADGSHTVKAVVTAGMRTRTATGTMGVTVNNFPVPPPPPPIQGPPVNATAPSIEGVPTEGQRLTVDEGTWTNEPTSYTYQWVRCNSGGTACVSISGATASTYVLVAADVASTIRCMVAAFNSHGTSAIVPSAQTEVIASLTPAVPAPTTPAPTISGTAVVGNQLSVSNGTWTGSPTSYSYQWRRCDSAGATCSSITGATANACTLTTADVGKTIRCQVTATNASGPSATAAESAQTAVVTSPPAPPPPSPGSGDLLRARFPAITPTTTVDDTGDPERTSTVLYDGTDKHHVLLKNIVRRGGSDDGFKIAGGAHDIEIRMCKASELDNGDKAQGVSFQRAPYRVHVYGGEYHHIGQPGDTLAHFVYLGAGAEDILIAGCLARDFSGYGLHAYPGPGSAVAANCTIIRSETRSGAVICPGFNLYIVNSIIAYNALPGVTDRDGVWKVENCCIWPRPSNYTDSRFVNCIFEDPQVNSSYQPQNTRLLDGGLIGWMAPHDYLGNLYTRKTIGARAA